MKKLSRRHWIILAICALVLIGLSVSLSIYFRKSHQQKISPSTVQATTQNPGELFVYDPENPPEGMNIAELSSECALTDKERYDAYDPDADPAHPVLDVKTSIRISNLGSRPGTPRPLDFNLEYSHLLIPPASSPTPTPTGTPVPTPSVTLTPGLINPGLKPGFEPPEINFPDLYIVNPDVTNPGFTGREFRLEWKYTGGRTATFDVSFSSDGGQSFISLSKNLTAQEYVLLFPDTPSEHCFLRVSAMVESNEYATADSNEFQLVLAPDIFVPPSSGNIDPQVAYVDLPGLRISSLSKLPVWFQVGNNAENTDKLVWQLSRVPFLGTGEMFGQEAGIVATGEIDTIGGEFSLDLNALCEEMNKPDADRKADIAFYPSSGVYEFYLRVVPLDAAGECIGDPGPGLFFTYGMPDIQINSSNIVFTENPQIQFQVSVPYYWEDRYERIPPNVLFRNPESESDFLLFAGMDGMHTEDEDSAFMDVWDTDGELFDAGEKGIGSNIISHAVQVEIQVATSPFNDAGTAGLIPPDGLVYSDMNTNPCILYNHKDLGCVYSSPVGHGIEYDQFALTKEELEAMGGIYYYARAIFYVPDSGNPSVLHAYPSETLTIAYTVSEKAQNEVQKITVKSCIPYVQFLGYTPVQWQTGDYDEYFEVARPVEPEEMTFGIGNDEESILAYWYYMKQPGATREQYQELLDELIHPGAVIHYVKAKPGYWEKFFDLLKSIYNGVSQAYADAKNSVISLVDYIPLIGDTARGYLKAAARYAIDYGLYSIGIPPSLPNLDELAEGGIDYITKVAVEEALKAAGVPADSEAAREITEKVRQEVADGLSSELQNAILTQKQNPLNATFLRLEQSRLYRPAYVDVFVCNYSKTYTAPSGELYVAFGDGTDIYKTRVVDIPSLEPDEHMTIRVYLDHFRNYYGHAQEFDKIYNGNSEEPFIMCISANFDLPDIHVAAMEQGLSYAPLPYVTEFVYDRPAYNYQFKREVVPANAIYESDPTPNAQDYLD